MSIIKIPDNLWYIIRNRQEGDTLSYMSYEDHTKGCEKKKVTGRKWAGRDALEFTVVNNPVQGFELGDAVSRSSTSNKLVRVTDPRGFTVELFIHNLCQVLANCTVVKGIIQEECRWGQNGAGHTLIPVGSDMERVIELMLELKRQKKPKFTELNLGDNFVSPQGDIYVWQGIYTFGGEVILKGRDLKELERFPYENTMACYTSKQGNGFVYRAEVNESQKYVLGVMESGTPTKDLPFDTKFMNEYYIGHKAETDLLAARKKHGVRKYYDSSTQITVDSSTLVTY